MVKYVGRHRRQPKWTPAKTVSSLVILTGFLAIPAHAGPQPLKEIKETKAKTTPLVTHVTEIPSVPVPIPPDPPGDGDDELREWLAEGGPGYLPDLGGKGVEADSIIPMPVAVIHATCNRGPASTLGLSPNAATVYEVICALFPEITAFGGLRVGDPQDHGSGNAIDCMIGTEGGNALASWLVSHAHELPISYVIWKQQIWQNVDGLRQWVWMEDRGSPTANHQDHVHISVW